MTETTTTPETAIEAMFKVGAHFGFSRARRHASVKEDLFGAKNGVDIIDLEKTITQLDRAKAFMFELGKSGKKVLFVGTKSEIRDLVEAAAMSLDMPYVAERWVGGTLTNWPEIKKRVARLKELSDKFAKGELEKYTKKERLLFERELATLRREFGGIVDMEQIPQALVIVDPREEHIAVLEGIKTKVPTVAILNSDCNKDEITHPILANDSAPKSVQYFLEVLRDEYRKGAKEMAV
jgi:small subunit ribosomal protein S2